MKTRILSLMILSIVSITNVYAQYSVKGKVIDKTSQEAVAFSKIIIKSLNIGVMSDADGNYELKNVPAGNHLLECMLLGYQNFQKTISISNANVTLGIELEKAATTVDSNTINSNYQKIDEIFVSATRANSGSPTTFTNINKEQIKAQNFGQDLPYLLESTPSTVVTSDAGAGVGYTGIRIRGVDPTRTNVTVNGIPLNDSESHGVYWVNMPDFASSVDNIQVQRGVGTSTNGAAAFGASMNIQTDKINREAYGEIANSYGSFNTWKNSVKAGTGLINNHYAFDVRLSKISSDGYIDRASSDLKSFFVSGTYLGKKSLLKANIFGGQEQTYQAWYGVPESKLKGNEDSLTTHFYNNYYPGGMYQDAADSTNLFSSNNRTYNIYNYNNETDNYQQTHYQLLYNYTFNPRFKLNLAGHYTHGEGYYEQYRKNDDFADYGLDTLFQGTDTITTTDLIRRRWLNNDFYGTVFSLDYTSKKGLNVIFGGAANEYKGKHYGEIIWARSASNSEIRDHYYDNHASKTDVNMYLKANKRFKKLTAFADLQVRTINYSYEGLEQTVNGFAIAQQHINYNFFNPKVGLVFDFNTSNQLYTSFSVANREPVRDDFRDNLKGETPSPETLNNLELGYRLAKKSGYFSANYYLMSYQNQLILTGKINDVGSYIRTNVDNSYRSGIELEAGRFFMDNKFQIKGNLTLSQNKIKEFTEYIDDYDNGGQQAIVHRNTDIAFSPNLIASLSLNYEPIKGLKFNLLSKYVGKQFLDNTSTDSRSLDAYYITNININYTTSKLFGKEITFGLLVNNVFNHLFENNGYTWGYIFGGKESLKISTILKLESTVWVES